MISIKAEVSGHYKIEIRKADGTVRQVLEFDNLITDLGLNYMGSTAGYLTYCQVGTGSATPAVTDVALVTWLAGTSTYASAANTAQSTPPYYCSLTKKFRFAAGTATGNLSEVGIGWASSGSALFSRALILDGVGSPTTITVLADETLDVTYEFRQYMPTVDTESTIILRAISHDYIGRASYVTSAATYAWTASTNGVEAGHQISTAFHAAYDGAIGAITGPPSGTSNAPTSLATNAYVADSFEREHILTWGLTAGNFATGITAIRAKMGIGCYQFGFTPAIMKTAADVFSITFKISWARKTL